LFVTGRLLSVMIRIENPGFALRCCACFCANMRKQRLLHGVPQFPHAFRQQTVRADNPFSYVHTSPDMLDLVDDIERVWAVKPGSKVLIVVAQYWPPLPYYLRAHRVLTGYYTPSDLLDAASKQEVVVVETSVELDKTVGEKKYISA
jgi:hypothetical protein